VDHSQAPLLDALADYHGLGRAAVSMLSALPPADLLMTTTPDVIEALGQLIAAASQFPSPTLVEIPDPADSVLATIRVVA
jgi:hypothetical protein